MGRSAGGQQGFWLELRVVEEEASVRQDLASMLVEEEAARVKYQSGGCVCWSPAAQVAAT